MPDACLQGIYDGSATHVQSRIGEGRFHLCTARIRTAIKQDLCTEGMPSVPTVMSWLWDNSPHTRKIFLTNTRAREELHTPIKPFHIWEKPSNVLLKSFVSASSDPIAASRTDPLLVIGLQVLICLVPFSSINALNK